MDYHPVANIFRLMDDEEFERLKADIRANGLLEPIWVYNGKIIDGRNRFEACEAVGVTPEFRQWNGQGSLIDFVVSLNMSRRHLDSSQRAALSARIGTLKEEEAAARRRQATSGRGIYGGKPLSQLFDTAVDGNGGGRAAQQVAVAMGTNRQYVSDAAKIEQEAPEILDLVLDNTIKIKDAKSLLKMEEPDRAEVVKLLESGEAKSVKAAQKVRKARAQRIVPDTLPPSLSDRLLLICGDMQEVADQIPDDSIDAIITDPPYSHEYLPLYESLAILAARVLKPGGSLLTMAGQSYLPTLFALMTPHIRYQWMVAYLTPGGQSPQIWDRRVNTFWKPVLWFVKGEYAGYWVGDVTKSGGNDKRFHEWGQSESGMADLVERFTLPGQMVLDPFMGGGTTGVVALRMNRRFTGIDIRLDAVETAHRRFQGIQHEQTAAD